MRSKSNVDQFISTLVFLLAAKMSKVSFYFDMLVLYFDCKSIYYAFMDFLECSILLYQYRLLLAFIFVSASSLQISNFWKINS